MTVSPVIPARSDVGNGVQVAFPLGFPYRAAADLVVTVDNLLMDLGPDFSVAGDILTFTAAPAAGVVVEFIRRTPIQQTKDFPTADTVKPVSIEDGLDLLTDIAQEQREATDGFNQALIDLGEEIDGEIADIEQGIADFEAGVNASLLTTWKVPAPQAGPVVDLAALVGLFLAVDAGGHVYGASGTGADGALRADLAGVPGSTLVSWKPSGSDAALRVSDKLGEHVSAADYRLGSDADESASILRAFDKLKFGGVVEMPYGGVISQTLPIPAGVHFLGQSNYGRSNKAGSRGWLKWNGVAGIPMLLIRDAIGARVADFRLIGNTAAKPSSALEISQAVVPLATQYYNSADRLYIGSAFGDDTDDGNQFKSGIVHSGTINGDSGSMSQIRITGCDDYAVDQQNKNASGWDYYGLYMQLCRLGGVRTEGVIGGTNWLFTNIGVDRVTGIALPAGGFCMESVSTTGGAGVIDVERCYMESNARLAKISGSLGSISIQRGTFQCTDNNRTAADDLIFDVAQAAGNWLFTLDRFRFLRTAGYTRSGPKLKLHNGPSVTSGAVRFKAVRGIGMGNCDFGALVGSNDTRDYDLEFLAASSQTPMPRVKFRGHFARAAERTPRAYASDHLAEFDVYGGPHWVRRVTDAQAPTLTAQGGGSGTNYSYRIAYLTYDGRTIAGGAAVIANGAALGGAVTNTITGVHVQGAVAMAVFGRVAGAEGLIGTVQFADDQFQVPPLYGFFGTPRFVDDGTVAPGALASTYTANTTGNLGVEGAVTVGVSTPTPITNVRLFSPNLNPVAVAPNTTVEQTFAVAGLDPLDKVIVNVPGAVAGMGLVGARVSALNTLALTFLNHTAGALAPAAGVYQVMALRT